MAFFLKTLFRKSRLKKYSSRTPTGFMPLRSIRSALVILEPHGPAELSPDHGVGYVKAQPGSQGSLVCDHGFEEPSPDCRADAASMVLYGNVQVLLVVSDLHHDLSASRLVLGVDRVGEQVREHLDQVVDVSLQGDEEGAFGAPAAVGRHTVTLVEYLVKSRNFHIFSVFVIDGYKGSL